MIDALRAIWCMVAGHRWALYQRYVLGREFGMPYEKCDRCGELRS